eukprot:6512564-Prymnesium_polylepis.1
MHQLYQRGGAIELFHADASCGLRSRSQEGFLVEELEDDHLEKADDQTLLMEVLKVVPSRNVQNVKGSWRTCFVVDPRRSTLGGGG